MRRAVLLSTLVMLAVTAVTVPVAAQSSLAPGARHSHEMRSQRQQRRELSRDRADLRRDRRDYHQDRKHLRKEHRAHRHRQSSLAL